MGAFEALVQVLVVHNQDSGILNPTRLLKQHTKVLPTNHHEFSDWYSRMVIKENAQKASQTLCAQTQCNVILIQQSSP
jgi:hypothetical protein